MTTGLQIFILKSLRTSFDEEELELIGKMRPGLIQLEIGVQTTNPDTIGRFTGTWIL